MSKKEEKNIKNEEVKEVKKETNKKNTSKKSNKTKKVEKKQKKHFFKDVKNELKKVRWPLKKEMITYSLATLVFIIILGLFFVATDLIIAGIRMVFI